MMRFFITTNLVSRILFLHYHLSAINIAVYLLLPTLVCILAKRRRAAFNQTYTWHYNTQGLPMHCIAAKHRELLPHIFTLTKMAVIFCGTFCSILRQTRLFTGELPYVVRTFLFVKQSDSADL